MLERYKSDDPRQRNHFKLAVLHIDDTHLLPLSPPEVGVHTSFFRRELTQREQAKQYVDHLGAMCTQMGLALYNVPLCDTVEGVAAPVLDTALARRQYSYPACQDRHSDWTALTRLFASLPGPTEKDDLLHLLRMRALAHAAQTLG